MHVKSALRRVETFGLEVPSARVGQIVGMSQSSDLLQLTTYFLQWSKKLCTCMYDTSIQSRLELFAQ